MKSLLIKDFFVIIKQLKVFLLIIPVIAITGGVSLSAMAILFGARLHMTAIAYDERSKWNELALMMPYTKKDLVFSKYLLGYICVAGSAILVILGQVLLQLMGAENHSLHINTVLFGVFSALIFLAINTPVLLKFGSEKGRFLFLIVVALIGAFGKVLDNSLVLSWQNISLVVFMAGALLLNVISVHISLNIQP